MAGPLSWYAADDATIQVAPAQRGEALQPPVAIVLRLSCDSSAAGCAALSPRTYVIVCRNGDAAIELPQCWRPKPFACGCCPRRSTARWISATRLRPAPPMRPGPGRKWRRVAGLCPLDGDILGNLRRTICLVNVDANLPRC